MTEVRIKRFGDQVVLLAHGRVCDTLHAVSDSAVFAECVQLYVAELRRQDAPVLSAFPETWRQEPDAEHIVYLLRALVHHSLDDKAERVPSLVPFRTDENRPKLLQFLDGLYDFWRSFDRFMVLQSDTPLERRSYRAFGDTVETLNHLVRTLYRDLRENIAGTPPRVYRQLPAGCNMALVVTAMKPSLPESYSRTLAGIPFIRVLWIAPPLLMEPPANKRGGGFHRLTVNPFDRLMLDWENWLCYPACVGPLTVFAYFHLRFMGLGCALANLFEMADDERIQKGPDAVCLFGVPAEIRTGAAFGEPVFYDDAQNDLVAGLVRAEPKFGYFGYLKKTILLLHNVVMMKRGRLPVHGAIVHVNVKQGASATLVIIGDTGTGKSETLEALRQLGQDRIRDMRIIADDMGSLEVAPDGRVMAYGTETGAFVRLDDLDRSYAFRTLDRAIFMNPHLENARVVLPVTTLAEVLRGYPVDVLLYANNHEKCDGDRPVLQRFETPEAALHVFGEGTSMSKGTTTSSGLVRNYFANIFGPPLYRAVHDELAGKVFRAAFSSGVTVGQLRTQLGLSGQAAIGPRQAADELLKVIQLRPRSVDCSA